MKSPPKKARTSQQTLFYSVIFIFILAIGWWTEKSSSTEPSVQKIEQSSGTIINDQKEPLVVLYSNQNHDDLRLTFAKAIQSARLSVFFSIYALTDPTIIQALKQKSEEGVSVYLVCDAMASRFVEKKIGSKVNLIKRYSKGLMHQKLLIIDNLKAWIGSANMTTDSLILHGNLLTRIDCPELASQIALNIKKMDEEGRSSPLPPTTYHVGAQTIELWLMPNKKGVDRLKKLIQSAKKSIRVAMFTFTRTDLAQEIIDAKNRGIKTEVIIDHYSGKGVSAKVAAMLKNGGVPVALSVGQALLHHKFMTIDEKILVNGSTNWTKAAFTQNDDCFIIISDLTKEQKKSMNHLWKVIKCESKGL